MFQHSLIIGGTGMLQEASQFLVDHSKEVTLVARSHDSLSRIIVPKSKKITLDYSNQDLFKTELRKQLECATPVDLLLSWMHSSAGDCIFDIAASLSKRNSELRLIEVLSSAVAKPGKEEALQFRKNQFAEKGVKNYQAVVLGFMLHEDHSRWLTHQEISSGVIDAITRNSPQTTVGVTTPWDRRP